MQHVQSFQTETSGNSSHLVGRVEGASGAGIGAVVDGAGAAGVGDDGRIHDQNVRLCGSSNVH